MTTDNDHEEGEDEGEECPICLLEMGGTGPSTGGVALVCGHMYHLK